MAVSLSIKDVPEALAERLRQRAARNHRSLQRELMAIVEAATAAPTASVAILAAAPAAPAYAAVPRAAASPANADAAATGADESAAGHGGVDSLLAELDAVVAGSRWGHAPVLTREQAHDRRLARELEYDSRQAPPPQQGDSK